MSAGECSRQRSQCLLVAFVCDVGEAARDLQHQALTLGNGTHGLLAKAFVEIVDRDGEHTCDLEEPPGRHAVYAALVLVHLLISDADEFGELLLGQSQHDPPFTDTGTDVIVDRRRR